MLLLRAKQLRSAEFKNIATISLMVLLLTSVLNQEKNAVVCMKSFLSSNGRISSHLDTVANILL